MDKLTLAQLAWRGNHHPSPVRRSGLGLRIYSYCTTTIQYYYYNTTTVCTVPFQSCNIRYNTILCYIIYTVLDNSNHSKHSPSSILHQPPTPNPNPNLPSPQTPAPKPSRNHQLPTIIHHPSPILQLPLSTIRACAAPPSTHQHTRSRMFLPRLAKYFLPDTRCRLTAIGNFRVLAGKMSPE